MSNIEKTINFTKDEVIFESGKDIENLYLIIDGTVLVYSQYGVFTLKTGSFILLEDSYFGISFFTYVADSDVKVISIPIKGISDIATYCQSNTDLLAKLAFAQTSHIMELIRNYLSLIVKCRKKNESYIPNNRLSKWELDKYNAIANMPQELFKSYYGYNAAITAAYLIDTARFATQINDTSLEMSDLLGINMDYVPPKITEPEPIKINHAVSDEEFEAQQEYVSSVLAGSLKKILAYSRMDQDSCERIINLINTFKKLSDKLSQDESIRRIRKEITNVFYELYYYVFKVAMDDDNLPPYISMFLHFGYIDESLISSKNQVILYKYVQDIEETCNYGHVYTIFNWLKHIVWGEKQPSKNGLDQDYAEYIKEQSRTGKLDVAESVALADDDMKLKFEIENMFTQAHRITYGRASSFVPILIEDNIYKPLDTCFLTGEDIIRTVDIARSIDFSLFFRTIVYSNEEIGITKEYIYKEILPDIILMPCIGTMGAMWQEIEGRYRNSSARIMLPIFCSGDTTAVALNAFGKYRWELCKRIQGAYWNNLSERSLTSEYYDYLQFYKKNRDLSEAVKEKIKSSLINARNNFPEVFAKDYEQWILHESKGISKLNKVSRIILGKYCPFNTNVRENLRSNPAYTDSIESYERLRGAQKKHFDLLAKSLISKGFEVPREIRESIAYLKR